MKSTEVQLLVDFCISSIEESNNTIGLRKRFQSEDREERKSILERFEKGNLTD